MAAALFYGWKSLKNQGLFCLKKAPYGI